ncbi:MAG: helix-turn-helix transcriptional regulator [Lachnospiraceae bacterium]|nr:helix-turn-helix transcriptional regulator [Lachnospiraceae bacterium]
MSDYKAAIGKRVSTLRKMNGMTQENLAELLDCSVKHISHSERGIALLSLEKYLFLSDYFGCSLDYLLKGVTPSDVSPSLPTPILEILRQGENEEQELLLAYLNMYSKIRNMRK